MIPSKQRPSPVIAVVGPTASGKSALAAALARRWNGEIISADSRQIYRGLGIGSDRVPGRWRSGGFFWRGVRHHLVDAADPRRALGAGEFVRKARQAIAAIRERGRTAIIAGGSGFWIDAALSRRAIAPVPPDPELRRRLASRSPTALVAMLRRMDPASAKRVDPQNPRRIIRAMEITNALGRVPPRDLTPAYTVMWIGLAPPQQKLTGAIRRRTAAMIRRGLAAEVRQLRRRGVSRRRIRELGFEYRSALDYLDRAISRGKLIARINQDTLALARAQLAWFRKRKAVRWFSSPERALAGLPLSPPPQLYAKLPQPLPPRLRSVRPR